MNYTIKYFFPIFLVSTHIVCFHNEHPQPGQLAQSEKEITTMKRNQQSNCSIHTYGIYNKGGKTIIRGAFGNTNSQEVMYLMKNSRVAGKSKEEIFAALNAGYEIHPGLMEHLWEESKRI